MSGDRARDAIDMTGLTGVDTGWLDRAAAPSSGTWQEALAALADHQPAGPGPSYSLFDLASAALQVEVCDFTGDPDLAQSRARPARSGPCGRVRARRRVGGIRARLLGVAYRCLGRYEQAETWLRDAVAQAGRAPAPAEQARARLNLAQVFMARGEDQAATAAIDESARTFAAQGLSGLLARSVELRRIVARGRS